MGNAVIFYQLIKLKYEESIYQRGIIRDRESIGV